MANKKSTTKPIARPKVAAAVKASKDSKPAKAAVTEAPVTEPADRVLHQILPYLIGVLAVFLLVCFFSEGLTGLVGYGLRALFYGLFGGGAFALPILLGLSAILWRKELKKGSLFFLILFEVLFFIFLSAMIHLWTGGSMRFDIPAFWQEGQSLVGGGVLGGMLGFVLYNLTGTVGAHIIGLSALFLFGLFMFGLTPYSIYVYIAYHIHEQKERRAAIARAQAEEEEKAHRHSKPVPPPPAEEEHHGRVRRDPIDRHRFDPDVEVGENGEPLPAEEPENDDGTAEDGSRPVRDAAVDEDEPPFDLDEPRPLKKKKLSKRPDLPQGGEETPEKVDLEEIFVDPDGLDVLARVAEEQKRKELEKQRMQKENEAANGDALDLSRSPATNDPPPAPVPEKKPYEFPPVSLLRFDNSPKNVDISEELHTNASKLVETLRSFKVRTRIVNVSRGPAITRYELAPEEGVRVRAIANLVDDIALNLATTGVRIEAPIPGKAAVGIEVPNKTVSTVYLRELVDTETFRKAQSRLHVSLGVDVAGDPVFLDIAKMPHLLIAGATGMGKSVCINSIITSLLYKGSPDEVKLILIDPKKVELNIYNGLPHLLVPVVSDPKKAAGSLQWAVTEMERRFEMIEEVGVRDLKMYNTVTKDDPDKEFLPQIVIIIDELADLMMTAPDDVETSICRLAQKARAAGMHLIIGTQRPSVDVITGLIKANIPSRIAFTVSSQTDSRVILDAAGAEKLIGRGDMLYAPVGASKPRRVQGAFVSETEVEQVVSFIKDHNGDQVEYSSDILNEIDRAAAACGSSGKKGSGSSSDGDFSDEGGDPMLRPAIELAIESGKISTSLIQRRLSLGYGRAAKLIDEMEKRGFVSAPEGQKPRTVLITKQQYMEMVLNRNEDL